MKELTTPEVIQILYKAERIGAETDEPEGSRYIQLSETLVLQMVAGLVLEHSKTLSLRMEIVNLKAMRPTDHEYKTYPCCHQVMPPE